MKPTYFSKLRLLTILLFAILLSAPGCQTRNFLKPNFSKMGFWNRDKMNLATKKLPPPSSQFAPEPTGTANETVDSSEQEFQQKVNDLAGGVQNEKEATLNNGLIRKPYSLDSMNPQLASEQSNGFEGTPAPFMNADNSDPLNVGTNSFENLKNTMQQTPQDISFKGSPSKTNNNHNSIDGWNRDFTPTPQKSIGSAQRATESFQPIPPSPAGQLNAPADPHQPMAGSDQNGFGLPPTSAATTGIPAQTNNNLLQPALPTIPRASLDPIQAPVTNDENQFGGSADLTPTKMLQNNMPESRSGAFSPIPASPTMPSETPTATYPETAYPTIKPLIPNPFNEAPNTSGKDSKNLALAPAISPNTSSSEVPDALRRGTGGFAPGSTKQMKPFEKNWQPPSNSN